MVATLFIVFIELPSAMIAISPVLIGSTNVPFYCETTDGSTTEIPKGGICEYNCTGRLKSFPPFSSIVQEVSITYVQIHMNNEQHE